MLPDALSGASCLGLGSAAACEARPRVARTTPPAIAKALRGSGLFLRKRRIRDKTAAAVPEFAGGAASADDTAPAAAFTAGVLLRVLL